MRASSNSARSIAVAGLTVCAFLLAQLPLGLRSVEAAPQTGTTPAPAATKPVVSKPRQKAPAAKALPRPSPPAAAASAPPTRPTFSSEDEAEATVLGIADVRAWADSEDEFARLLPKAEGPWLAMSGGGSDGAYAAGLLVGMSQAGSRPEFAVVTGASIGALIAPYAFLGSRYDGDLQDQFTTVTAGDIFEDRATGDSLMDSWPLKRTIEKRVTPQLLADIAAEHRRGRRLLVVTTNLDAGRPVVWNMGAIAERGDDKALDLFRRVLLASASIPGIFPPVTITADSQGREITELYNDGTITAPFFIAPVPVLSGTGTVHLPTNQLYVIANAKLTQDFEMTTPQQTAVVLGRSISLALQAGLRIELLLTLEAAQKQGWGLKVAQIDPEFQHPSRGAFDPDYMKALFDFALEKAKKGNVFETVVAEQH
ncbi:MAG TPA: patatin-like phospholipase family protein [Xanthobacteraceae bacterium]|nr:patatin-like phospholipase family protein [Xanthobacteraceae bacterium]